MKMPNSYELGIFYARLEKYYLCSMGTKGLKFSPVYICLGRPIA